VLVAKGEIWFLEALKFVYAAYKREHNLTCSLMLFRTIIFVCTARINIRNVNNCVEKKLKAGLAALIQWDCGTVFGSFKCCGLKMNTDIDLEPKLRMRGDVPPTSYAYSWRGAQLNTG